jgi:hypothetical protein
MLAAAPAISGTSIRTAMLAVVGTPLFVPPSGCTLASVTGSSFVGSNQVMYRRSICPAP